MPWEDFLELHEMMDYISDYKYLVEKSRSK